MFQQHLNNLRPPPRWHSPGIIHDVYVKAVCHSGIKKTHPRRHHAHSGVSLISQMIVWLHLFDFSIWVGPNDEAGRNYTICKFFLGFSVQINSFCQTLCFNFPWCLLCVSGAVGTRCLAQVFFLLLPTWPLSWKLNQATGNNSSPARLQPAPVTAHLSQGASALRCLWVR